MNRTENSRPVHNAVKLQKLTYPPFWSPPSSPPPRQWAGKAREKAGPPFWRWKHYSWSPSRSSGSFLAPNKRKTITRMAIISGVPSPKIANMFIMEYYSIFNIFFSCRILHNTLHASSEDCRSCFCCSASLLAAKR